MIITLGALVIQFINLESAPSVVCHITRKKTLVALKHDSHTQSKHVNSECWAVMTCSGNESDVTSLGCAWERVLHHRIIICIPIELLKDN